MTARPMIYSGPMVRALMEGSKSQTRRLLKPAQSDAINRGFAKESIRLRYAPGDQIWVKELWRTWSDFDHLAPSDLPSMPKIHYMADQNIPRGMGRVRSPMHMPRWASRITLTVTDVRVHRVQSITEADAMAEGVEPILEPPDGGSAPHVAGYRALWDAIHGPGAWARNDWVVALTFDVRMGNVDG